MKIKFTKPAGVIETTCEKDGSTKNIKYDPYGTLNRLASEMTVKEKCLLAYRCAALTGLLAEGDCNSEPSKISFYCDEIAQAVIELDKQE